MKSDDWRGEMLTRYPDLTDAEMRGLESLQFDYERQVDAMVRWVQLREAGHPIWQARFGSSAEAREFYWLTRMVSAIGCWRRG